MKQYTSIYEVRDGKRIVVAIVEGSPPTFLREGFASVPVTLSDGIASEMITRALSIEFPDAEAAA